MEEQDTSPGLTTPTKPDEETTQVLPPTSDTRSNSHSFPATSSLIPPNSQNSQSPVLEQADKDRIEQVVQQAKQAFKLESPRDLEIARAVSTKMTEACKRKTLELDWQLKSLKKEYKELQETVNKQQQQNVGPYEQKMNHHMYQNYYMQQPPINYQYMPGPPAGGYAMYPQQMGGIPGQQMPYYPAPMHSPVPRGGPLSGMPEPKQEMPENLQPEKKETEAGSEQKLGE
eukprot:snap_masked-scaffold_20-processed-gene-2.29-mRNA-1 protein AED:1.00 eAED:1.00 QI:0/-1/0/0/-1/1/1/0/228